MNIFYNKKKINPVVVHTTGEVREGEIIRKSISDGDMLLQDVIGTYVSIRDQRRTLEEMVTTLKEKEDQAEEELWNLLESMKLKSVKTDEYGTVTRVISTTPYVSNTDSFMTWIRSTGNFQLLYDRIRVRELRAYIDAKEKVFDPESIPPGITVKQDKRIQIRSPRE